MKEGKRSVAGVASLSIRVSSAVPKHMRGQVRELVNLYTEREQRGHGLATTLMHKVCREADAEGITLLLWPKHFGETGGPDDDWLTAWYNTVFGFQVIQAEPRLMARMPGSTPRMLELKPITRSLYKAKA